MKISQSALEKALRAKKQQTTSFDIEKILFDKQLAFVKDPSNYKIASCSRRAGKTVASAAYLIQVALSYENIECVYITHARTDAKKIVWEMLLKLLREHKIAVDVNIADLAIKFPNGSVIYLSGAADAGAINRFRGHAIKLAIVDECFHPNTQIETTKGLVAIKDVQVGDFVKNALGYSRVISKSKKHKDKYVKLFYNNTEVKCSLNHPFFTKNGWVKAVDLKPGDQLASSELSMRILQKRIPENSTWLSNISFLRKQLQCEMEPNHFKSNEQSKDQEQNVCNTSQNKAHTTSSWWKWSWSNRPRKSAYQLFKRCCLEPRNWARVSRKWISNQLQSRFGLSGIKISNRSRWIQPLCNFEANARSKERGEVGFFRVESVEIHKCSSDPTNRRGDFYDLGVEGHPSFTVAEALVHNCQRFREYIKDLVDDVIEPALMDYNGTVCLIGTPGPIPTGFFHDVVNNKIVKGDNQASTDLWSRHTWTFFDNPFIPKTSGQSHEKFLTRVMKRRGLTIDHPSIRREYFGEWLTDSDALLIHYNPLINHYDNLQSDIYHYIMGIDLGFNDADAIAVLAWSDNSPITYLVEERITKQQGLTPLVQQIRELQQKYNVYKMVIDEGGLGKKLAEEMRRQYQVPVQAADKVRKHENIAFLNDALRTGRFKAKKDSRFVADSYLVEVDVNKTTPDRIRVSDAYHSDIIDSVLYAFKESPSFSYSPPEEKAKVGTPEWSLRESERMFQEHLERAQSMKDTSTNPFDTELDRWRNFKD